MEIKKIRVPYGLSVHGTKEIKAVVQVLRGNTALGEMTREFERKIAKLFGKRFGIMVNSGSSANLLALEILKLPKGSEVITPLLTFSTTVAPIVQKGLVPVFIDVIPGGYVINVDKIEKRITKRTKALLIPSLIGNIPNLKKIRHISKKHRLWFIEDSCDTLGATIYGMPTGRYSDITTTSFYGSHIINGAGGGGMIMVNNPEWASRLTVLRGWGRMSSLFGESRESENTRKRFGKKLGSTDYDAKFIFSEIGYNFLPLEVSSAFALAQLEKLKKFILARRNNFARLLNFFKKFEEFFILPEPLPLTKTAWLALPLTIRKNAPFIRKELCTYLERRNIQTRPIFTGNILYQPAFKKILHKSPGSYPVTNHIMSHGFLIGCHHGLGPRELGYLEETFAEFLRKYE